MSVRYDPDREGGQAMSIPITTEEIARAAIRFVKASIAHGKHEQSTDWRQLDRHDMGRALGISYALADELNSARAELFGLVGRHEGQQQGGKP